MRSGISTHWISDVKTVELRVLVQTHDDRAEAADRIESQVRRNLGRDFDPAVLYVEQITTRH